MSFLGSSFFWSPLGGGEGGVADEAEDDAPEGGELGEAAPDDEDEDGVDGAIADDEEEEGGGDGAVVEELDVDGGGELDVVVVSRWQAVVPNTSAMASTSGSLWFNICTDLQRKLSEGDNGVR